MKGLLIGLVALLIVGYGATQAGRMVSAKSDLTTRVERNLEFVDENSFDTVKDDLVQTAAKLDVELVPGHIEIVYEDSDQQLYQQRALGKVAQFKNKRVGIAVHYQWRIMGFGIRQEISRTRIKQMQVQQRALPKEYQELLE